MTERDPWLTWVTQTLLVLSSLLDYHHCAGVSGYHESETRFCHVAAEVVIHNDHGDDAETESASVGEAERQNAPVRDEAGVTACANTPASEGGDGVPDMVSVTLTEIATAFAHAPHDDGAERPSYTSHAHLSLDGVAWMAVASCPFSSPHPLHAPVSSDPPPFS